MPRKREIEAAVADYNATADRERLPRNAARLLTVMFPAGDECQRSLDSMEEAGFDRASLLRALRRLAEAGFLSTERSRGGPVPNTYRLHLPPRRQP